MEVELATECISKYDDNAVSHSLLTYVRTEWYNASMHGPQL